MSMTAACQDVPTTKVSATFAQGHADLTVPKTLTLGDLAVLLSTYAEQSGQALRQVTVTRH